MVAVQAEGVRASSAMVAADANRAPVPMRTGAQLDNESHLEEGIPLAWLALGLGTAALIIYLIRRSRSPR